MNDKQYKKSPWIGSTTVYEVNIRQYTKEGTFNAFVPELPRLKDMGVETLWFMPITPISQKNKKGSLGSYYACSDYTSVNPEFGTAADLKNLIDRAHTMGFKIIMDWVANHTGWDHVWTKTNPEFYQADAATGDFKMASGMEDIIELDFKNPALRKAMIDAMQYWVKNYGIDGFRCDLAFWVELDFWKEARTALEKTATVFWLGEFDPLENRAYAEVFDAGYTWTWMHKTAEFYKGTGSLDNLKLILQQYQQVCGTGHIPAWFTSNHDENSWNGTEYEKYGDMARSLAVFSFTWDGLPLIYSGQELPNTKRLEFFEKDTITWNGNNTLHGFYKILSSLKKNKQALLAGDKKNTTHLLKTVANENCFGYIRAAENDAVLVLLNWSNEKISFGLADEAVFGNYTNVFSGAENSFNADSFFEMGPWEFLVYEKK